MLEDRNAPNGLGNSSPFAADDWFEFLHDTTLFANLLSNDYGPDDAITAQRVSGPTNGALTLKADGSFTYTPNTHYVGPDSFTYTWSDGIASTA